MVYKFLLFFSAIFWFQVFVLDCFIIMWHLLKSIYVSYYLSLKHTKNKITCFLYGFTLCIRFHAAVTLFISFATWPNCGFTFPPQLFLISSQLLHDIRVYHVFYISEIYNFIYSIFSSFCIIGCFVMLITEFIPNRTVLLWFILRKLFLTSYLKRKTNKQTNKW